jgi:hypothetical protein
MSLGNRKPTMIPLFSYRMHLFWVILSSLSAATYTHICQTLSLGMFYFCLVAGLNSLTLHLGQQIQHLDTNLPLGIYDLRFTIYDFFTRKPEIVHRKSDRLVLQWLLSLLATLLCTWMAIQYAALSYAISIFLLALFATCIAIGLWFIQDHSERSAQNINRITLLWGVGVYLSLGLLQWL